MTKKYDLHCHTSFSDGILSPEELVSRAKTKDVSVLAITDHDTVSAYPRAIAEAEQSNIELITGIELSTEWCGVGIHIVGLNIDIQTTHLLEAIDKQEQARELRARMIAEKLLKKGIENAYEGAKELAGNGVIGRPHFAKYMVQEGYVKNVNAAFNRYLGAGKPGDVKMQWPQVSEAVEWILSAKGTPVLAHPAKYKMTRTKLCRLIEAFTEFGGLAIEILSGKQSPDVTNNLSNLAMKYHLLGSCGSDFHAPNCPWQELGEFGTMPASIEPVWNVW